MEQASPFRLLEHVAQPAFATLRSTVCYVNPAAESLGIQIGRSLYQSLFAKEYPLPSKAGSRFDCELRGELYSAVCVWQEEYTVYYLTPRKAEAAPGFPGSTLAHTSTSIRQSIHEILFSLSELYAPLTKDEDPRTLERASVALRGVYQLERIADNLDSLQKLRSGSYAPAFEPLDLSQLFLSLLTKAAELLRYIEIPLEYDVAAGLRGVSDRNLLSLIFWNLLSNAAADCDGSAISCSVRKSSAAAVELCVENRSASPLLEHSALFARHTVSPDESLSQRGVGTGISVIRAAAETLGGRFLVSQAGANSVRALVSFDVTTRQEALLRSEVLLPRRSIDEGLVGLSPVLRPNAFDPRDLL